MRILVVEDDARIAFPIASGLRRENHLVDVAGDGRRALALAERAPPDVIILDIMLPAVNGVDVCRTLRERGSEAMIVMMSARDAVKDKIDALDAGADDYVVKPVEIAELCARVRALSRRRFEQRSPILRHGELELWPQSSQATYRGRIIKLTRTEYAIVETFLRDPSRVFSRSVLQHRLAKIDKVGDSNTVKTHLSNLRKKFREAGCDYDPIIAVYALGYRLADVE